MGAVVSGPGVALGSAMLLLLLLGLSMSTIETTVVLCMYTATSWIQALALVGLPGAGMAFGLGVPAALWIGWLLSLLLRRWLGLTPARINQLLRLNRLAPSIQKEILSPTALPVRAGELALRAVCKSQVWEEQQAWDLVKRQVG